MATNVTIGVPWCSAGISSISGACHSTAMALISSGAVAAHSR